MKRLRLAGAAVGLLLLVALLGPLLAPHSPVDQDLEHRLESPSRAHPFGLDELGRDILARLLWGARVSMLVGFTVVGSATLIGLFVGALAGTLGGRVDALLMRVLDVLFAFPGILLAILAAAVFGPSLFSAALALSIAYSPYVARVLRGAALKERAMTYIAALEVQGFGAWRLCVRHLLPNISSLIVAQGTILFGFAMVDLAAISVLGLGVQTPQADWGVMINEGKTSLLQGYPLVALSAVLCIVAVVAAVSFLGDRLDTASKDVNR